MVLPKMSWSKAQMVPGWAVSCCEAQAATQLYRWGINKGTGSHAWECKKRTVYSSLPALGTVWNHICEVVRQTTESICFKKSFFLPFPISLLLPSFLTHGIIPSAHSAELMQYTNLAEKQPFSLVFCWTGELVCLTVGSGKPQTPKGNRSGSEIAPFSIHE